MFFSSDVLVSKVVLSSEAGIEKIIDQKKKKMCVFSFKRLFLALQDIHEGDEMFWFETTLLLVDSVLHDYSNRHRKNLVSWFIN